MGVVVVKGEACCERKLPAQRASAKPSSATALSYTSRAVMAAVDPQAACLAARREDEAQGRGPRLAAVRARPVELLPATRARGLEDLPLKPAALQHQRDPERE